MFACALAAVCALVVPAPGAASSFVRYGIQDDAWLVYGPGTLESRFDRLESLGVKLVRFNLRWDEIARRRPENPRSSRDPAYRWGTPDAVLGGLRKRRIVALVTLLGTPRWANGGNAFNSAPTDGTSFGNFAFAAASRYGWVRDWLVWNEPNQRRWLRPTSARVYTLRLLNPAYREIHRAIPGARVAGGATAPRANFGGVSPIAWIRGMRQSRALLDAYAHHPYPLRPKTESPTAGACAHCATITMATLDRLLGEVRRAFGPKRIWLTEYGYQTNPPDSLLGVSQLLQARYLSEAAELVHRAPLVDVLIQFLVVDDSDLAGWQSGLFRRNGTPKLSATAFVLPFAQTSRRGFRTVLWGQLRLGSGRRPFRLQEARGGEWVFTGGTRLTNARGVLSVVVRAERGSLLRVWSPRDGLFSAPLVVR